MTSFGGLSVRVLLGNYELGTWHVIYMLNEDYKPKCIIV
jgi:hypothetical protein